jgi:hypothetical protein
LWEATGGTIDIGGLYTAGFESGDFTVTASVGDISGQADVTIVSPNQPPTALDDDYDVDEDDTLNVSAPGVLSNDSDPDLDPMTAVLISDVSSGALNLNPDGSFSYDPDPEYSGPDSFTYIARDTSGADSNVATVNITVNIVNDSPVAVDDSYDVDENSSLVVPAPGVLANDSDIELDAFTAELVSDASNGALTLNPDGSFTYDPDPTYSGSDSFTYLARDTGGAASNIATVNITVNDLILGAIHFSTGIDTTIDGLSVGREDIVEFDGAAFSIYFDGSDVGLSGLIIDSISIVSANQILLSFEEQANIVGIGTVDPVDVVRFNATSLGDTTSGAFELYFDGSAAGLIGNLIFAIE